MQGRRTVALGEVEEIFEGAVLFGAWLLWRITISFLHGG
jgi:hypothetical protein